MEEGDEWARAGLGVGDRARVWPAWTQEPRKAGGSQLYQDHFVNFQKTFFYAVQRACLIMYII